MGRAYEVRKASIQKTGAAKAKLYSMYAREIYQAAKTGGVDIESNAQLKRLTERAKKEQVPSDIIKKESSKTYPIPPQIVTPVYRIAPPITRQILKPAQREEFLLFLLKIGRII